MKRTNQKLFSSPLAALITAIVIAGYGAGGQGMPTEERDPIGIVQAEKIVLTQHGLKDANFTKRQYDWEDNVYELEFTLDGVKYEYEVDALTGRIASVDRDHPDWDDKDDVNDRDDDWDDKDDRDDHDDDRDDKNDVDDWDDHDDDRDDKNDVNDWDDHDDDRNDKDDMDDWDDHDDDRDENDD